MSTALTRAGNRALTYMFPILEVPLMNSNVINALPKTPDYSGSNALRGRNVSPDFHSIAHKVELHQMNLQLRGMKLLLPSKESLLGKLLEVPQAHEELLRMVAEKCGGAEMSFPEIRKAVEGVVAEFMQKTEPLINFEADKALAARISLTVAAAAKAKIIVASLKSRL